MPTVKYILDLFGNFTPYFSEKENKKMNVIQRIKKHGWKARIF